MRGDWAEAGWWLCGDCAAGRGLERGSMAYDASGFDRHVVRGVGSAMG
jgi:hypothetical protein